ncbi:MAG: GtrA family protein [Chitinophagaceae bacterium]
MKRVHHIIRNSIFKILDVFYPLVQKWMPLQTYHYAACGGSNTVLSLFLYFIGYNYILKKQIVHFGSIAISPHIMALLITSIITLPIGFYLSMFVVFQGSYLKRRIQFFRYFLVVIACLILNYIFLKIFVEILGWYPTVSQIVNTLIVVSFSFLSQRHFSFKVQKVQPSTAIKN